MVVKGIYWIATINCILNDYSNKRWSVTFAFNQSVVLIIFSVLNWFKKSFGIQ